MNELFMLYFIFVMKNQQKIAENIKKTQKIMIYRQKSAQICMKKKFKSLKKYIFYCKKKLTPKNIFFLYFKLFFQINLIILLPPNHYFLLFSHQKQSVLLVTFYCFGINCWICCARYKVLFKTLKYS